MSKRRTYLLPALWVLLSGVVAHLVAAAVLGVEYRGYSVGNPVYAASLTGLVVFTRAPSRIGANELLAIFFALVFFAAAAFIGLLLADTSPPLARFLAGPLTSIGTYPSGPDAWFPAGAAIWLVSSYCLSIGCCLLGNFVAQRFAARENRDSN